MRFFHRQKTRSPEGKPQSKKAGLSSSLTSDHDNKDRGIASFQKPSFAIRPENNDNGSTEPEHVTHSRMERRGRKWKQRTMAQVKKKKWDIWEDVVYGCQRLVHNMQNARSSMHFRICFIFGVCMLIWYFLPCACSVNRGRKRALDPWSLSYHVHYENGTQVPYSALNCWAISLEAHSVYILKLGVVLEIVWIAREVSPRGSQQGLLCPSALNPIARNGGGG